MGEQEDIMNALLDAATATDRCRAVELRLWSVGRQVPGHVAGRLGMAVPELAVAAGCTGKYLDSIAKGRCRLTLALAAKLQGLLDGNTADNS